MPLINFLSNHIDRLDSRSDLRPINRNLSSGDAAPANSTRPERRVMDGQRTNVRMSRRCNSVYANAAIYNRVVVYNVVVDDSSMVINPGGLRERQTMARIVMVVKVMKRNECEVLRPKTEIEVEADMYTVEAVAEV